VNAPRSASSKKEAGLDYYIDAAGGFGYAPNQGRTSVRYTDGEVETRHESLFFRSDPTPGPGSAVSVPPKGPNTPLTGYVALFGAVARILVSSVAIIVVLRP
jgi:hypothetical protein